MNELLSRPSGAPSSSLEVKKTSNFRLAIAFILTICAGFGIGKCIFDKKDAEMPNKPEKTNLIKPDTAQIKQKILLRHCSTNLLKVTNLQCEELSSEEIEKQYLEREKANLEKRTLDIIEKLKITNPQDQEKILEAVLKGCSEIRKASKKSIKLDSPPPIKECLDTIRLSESPRRNLLLNEEKYNELSDEEKELVDLYRDKKLEEALRRLNFDKERKKIDELAQTDEEFRRLGIAEYFKIGFDFFEQTRAKMLGAKNDEERLKIFCMFLDDSESSDGLTDEQQQKMHELDKSGAFQSESVYDFKEEFVELIFLAMTGMTEREVVESKVCDPYVEKTSESED